VNDSHTDQDLADLETILGAARRLSRSPDVYIRGGMTRIVAIATVILRNACSDFTDRALEWEGPQALVPFEMADSNAETRKGQATS
jgi:hypothetical protein